MLIYLKFLFIINISIAGASTEKLDTKYGNVVLAEKVPELSIGEDWSEKVIKKLYNSGVSLEDKFNHFMINNTPVSGIQFDEQIFSNFDTQSDKISKYCKIKNPEEILNQISCIAQSIKSTVELYGYKDKSTYCRTIAHAFNDTLKKLNIKGSESFFWNASHIESGHVVNRFVLTDEKGNYYSYVIDVGHKPDTLFPLALNTQIFHERNDRLLPEITITKQCEDKFNNHSALEILKGHWQSIQDFFLE